MGRPAETIARESALTPCPRHRITNGIRDFPHSDAMSADRAFKPQNA